MIIWSVSVDYKTISKDGTCVLVLYMVNFTSVQKLQTSTRVGTMVDH